MNARLLGVMRFLQRALSWFVTLVLVLLVAASCAAYLAATGKSLPLLRAITARVGQFVAGQHTEQLTLDVRVIPADSRLTGTAQLTVRSLEDGRQRFYFLLNDGLRLRGVHLAGIDAAPRPLAAYQLWLLVVVDIGAPVAKDATLQLSFDYDGVLAPGMFGVTANVVNPQHVLLNVDGFWYPSDVQGFFSADVTVTVPASMTVVHNGAHATRIQRGDVQQVHWTSERPIGGLSLVAGAYALQTLDADGDTYRLYLPDDVQLDANRILQLMADANRILEERYGASGFRQLTLFVSREVRRGFNDGSGLMGLSIRYFRAGDYGFATIAHEIAHNWWGGTVAEKWLSPGTGGEWLVEGFAEFSSVMAAEATHGTEALTRRLAGEFFDPARQAAIADMSVLDNVLAEATARDTIYRKGAYVAFMLRRTLGDDVYFRGLRQFIERFRYRQATERDLQQVLEEVSEQKLDTYFADWVRSDHLADLSLDATNPTEVVVNNLGAAAVPGDVDLWTFKKDGSAPTRSTVHVGDHVPFTADTDYAVLDPQLVWADVQRENNRYPRRTDPIHIAAAHGELVVTHGGPFPWVRAAVSSLGSDGRTQHTWEFTRGVAAPPAWSADGARIIVSYADAEAVLPAIVTLAADGTRRTVGTGTAPVAADGAIYAGKQDRIVRLLADGTQSTVIERCGETLDLPLPSPDGTRLVYSATRGNHLELRVVNRDGSGDRFLLSSDRDRMVYRWSTDGTRLYTIAGGNWDWQLWEIPLGTGAVRVLASGAAAVADLAVSPDGSRLAFTAVPALDYPLNRHQLYIMHLDDRTVRSIDMPDTDVSDLAWINADTLAVVATPVGADHPWTLPTTRTLKRVRVADGSVEDLS